MGSLDATNVGLTRYTDVSWNSPRDLKWGSDSVRASFIASETIAVYSSGVASTGTVILPVGLTCCNVNFPDGDIVLTMTAGSPGTFRM